jgi:hypothetical protein
MTETIMFGHRITSTNSNEQHGPRDSLLDTFY